MLNVNNLNRIQGILSANKGALVPKLIGGNPINFQKYADYVADCRTKGIVPKTLDEWELDLPENNADDLSTEDPYPNFKGITRKAFDIVNQNKRFVADLRDPSTLGHLQTPKEQVEAQGDKLQISPEAVNKIAGVSDQVYTAADNAKNHVTGGITEKTEEEKQASLNLASNNMSVIGQGADMARNLIFSGQNANNSETTQSLDLGYLAISDGLMKFAPVGTIVGGAMKVGAFAGDALLSIGGGTDQMTKTDLIMDSSFFSWNIGAINGFAGKKSDSMTVDSQTLEEVGGSYGGTSSDIRNAADKAGKKYGLFSFGARNKANKAISDAVSKQNTMTDIADEARTRRLMSATNYEKNALAYHMNLSGGYDLRYMRAAKVGAKLSYFKVELEDPFDVLLSDILDINVLKSGGILDKIDLEEEDFKVTLTDIIELKQGGNIKEREIEVIETNTTQKSVIPEGALHKNKHHLDEVGIDDSELTKKGIPVVDNAGDLLAEIELNEIIFTLEVTKELEKRYKEFYEESTTTSRKEELALEAGKLLWKEILYNTDDRTGLIDTLKKGGTLKVQEGKQVLSNKNGGTLNQSDIDKMVRQALKEILCQNLNL